MAEEIQISPLTRPEVSWMAQAILRTEGAIHPGWLDRLMLLSEGNPFFVEEMIKSLREPIAAPGERDPLPIPRGIQQTVQRRIEGLADGTWRVLLLASVIGERFDFGLLQEMAAEDEQTLLRRLKELIAAQVIVEKGEDQFAFVHALTREAVYATLMLRERKAMHRTIGETLERQAGGRADAPAAPLAYHFYQAGVWQKAMGYAQRAGEKAQALYAPREALTHFSHALDAARELGIPVPLSALRGRAHARESLGDFDGARTDHEAVLESARHGTSRVDEWQALIDLGFLWQSRDLERTGQYYQHALELARNLGDSVILAQSLNRVGYWRWNRGQFREGLSCHQQALALFQELNDQRGIAHTLELMGFASYGLGEIVQGARYCERAVPILRGLDDRQGLVNALGSLSLRSRFDTEVLGDVDLRQLAGLSEAAAEVARSCGYRKGEADALARAAICLCRAGDYGQGLECLRQALDIAEEIQHRELLTTVHLAWGTELHLGLLAPAQAREHLETALASARELRSANLTLLSTAHLVCACVLQNDLVRAQQLLEAVLPDDLPDATEATMPQRGLLGRGAELELALRHPARSLNIVDGLLAGTANLREYGQYAVPRLTRLRGNALTALGRIEEAVADLEGALTVARAQGQRPLLWRIRADLGKAYRSMGRRDHADEQFSLARAMIQEVSDTLPSGMLHDHFLKQALAGLPAAPVLTPRRVAMKALGGLTERERQVAALIASGSSNREIAHALVITERTVEAHITSILTKLDLRSRTEIAAWAIAKGLRHPPV